MVRKIYKKLTDDQINRGVVFSSCLSEHRNEAEGDTIHEVLSNADDKNETIQRLQDDSFFNQSHFKFNIIRQ